MNNDPYYQDLVAAGVPPATAAIMFTQNQQFVQMNHQFAQQQQTILALTNEIKDLAANKRPFGLGTQPIVLPTLMKSDIGNEPETGTKLPLQLKNLAKKRMRVKTLMRTLPNSRRSRSISDPLSLRGPNRPQSPPITFNAESAAEPIIKKRTVEQEPIFVE